MMGEMVEIEAKALEELISLARIQEDGRCGGERVLKEQLEACLSEADSLSGLELAERVEKVAVSRVYSDYRAETGDFDLYGDRVGTDYPLSAWNVGKPVDLSPIGQGSIFGKILLELAKRLKNEHYLAEKQRERTVAE